MKILWELPVPSSSLGGGPEFTMRPGRLVALRIAHEAFDGDEACVELTFDGVEAFRVTHRRARHPSMREAYDRLIERRATPWLDEVRALLESDGGDARGLAHYVINFDDGPCYEVLARSWQVL